MTEQSKTKIPGPVYAVAGAGELAFQQLRKLPTVLSELTDRAATSGAQLRERAAAGTVDLRQKAVAGSAELRERARAAAATLRTAGPEAVRTTALDVDQFRELARRNAGAFLSSAQAAQEKAAAVYEELVARGVRVIGRSAATATAAARRESNGAAAAVRAAPGPTLSGGPDRSDNGLAKHGPAAVKAASTAKPVSEARSGGPKTVAKAVKPAKRNPAATDK